MSEKSHFSIFINAFSDSDDICKSTIGGLSPKRTLQGASEVRNEPYFSSQAFVNSICAGECPGHIYMVVGIEVAEL